MSIVCLLCYLISIGQEGIYSQPFQSGIFLNPALIGSTDVTTRVGGVYRTHWKVEDAPYEDYGLFFESKINTFKYGLVLNQSKTGDIGFKKTSVLLAAGLSKKLGAGNNYLSVGTQFGLYQMKVDYVKLQFDNQYNSLFGYDSSLRTGEGFESTNLIQPDINIGLALDFELKTKLKIDGQIGLSIIHIKTPGRVFNKEAVILPMKTIFHTKAFIHVNDSWGFEPLFIFTQDVETEMKAGLNLGFKLKDNSRLKFGAANDFRGLYCFLTQVEIDKFSFGLSIDANISNTNNSISGYNTFELSIIYNISN
ncbi:MAG: type IX secretion system PorP/SprF family membrane protein [Saprospiraceae bacterium]|jgi:type IX secretion system PorP/SprF family membrane protein